MKGRTLLISSLILAISIFYAVSINAGTQVKKGMGGDTFMGSIKEVDCKTGEIKLTGKTGEEALFNLTEKTEFKNIKGCDDIKKDGRVLIQYSDAEGKKVVKIIKYRPPRSKEEAKMSGDRKAQAEKRNDLFMGWAGSVDCEKGVLILQQMTDRSKTETFALDKGTIFSDDMKECNDIKTSSIVAISYEKKGDDKVVKTLKSMIAPSAPGRK